MKGARVFGVLSGTPEDPRTAYLAPGVTIDSSVTDRLAVLEPTRVFRFAAKCEESRCAHFAGNRCSLADRIVGQLPAVVDALPDCQIRGTCRWFAEQRGAACLRCPQVVTMVPKRPDALNRVAMPDAEADP